MNRHQLQRGSQAGGGSARIPRVCRWTGDLGYVADGNVFICGRKRDVIIVQGGNFYPTDLEAEALGIAALRPGGVVAFGVESHGSEEVVMAAEAAERDADLVAAEVRNRVGSRFGLPIRDVVVVPFGTLPRTSSGKAQRGRAKAMYMDGMLRRRVVLGGAT